MRRPRIAVIASFDTRTPAAASGTPYYMARALERHVGDVIHLGPAFSWRELAAKVRSRLVRVVSGRLVPYIHGHGMAKAYARVFARRLPPNVDAIFAPLASTQIAYLDTPLPILYTSDTTFALLNGYYPEFTG